MTPDPRGGATCVAYDRERGPRRIADLDEISEAIAAPSGFVWLDLLDPTPEDFAMMQREFALHPLAIEDAIQKHERPKIESYGKYWFVVLEGASRRDGALEIDELAIFASRDFVITIRSKPAFGLDEVRRRWDLDAHAKHRDGGDLLYEILDAVVDGYSPVAASFEEDVASFESALVGDAAGADGGLLRRALALKNEVMRFRRAVLPVRDLLVPIIRGDVDLFDADQLPYYRDVLDHVVHAIEQTDTAREVVANALDIYLALAASRQAANAERQNGVTKQLTIIATIFLPLTYITGFFGQNFGYLTNHITSARTFAWVGVGSQVAAVAILLAYFRYKRWF